MEYFSSLLLLLFLLVMEWNMEAMAEVFLESFLSSPPDVPSGGTGCCCWWKWWNFLAGSAVEEEAAEAPEAFRSLFALSLFHLARMSSAFSGGDSTGPAPSVVAACMATPMLVEEASVAALSTTYCFFLTAPVEEDTSVLVVATCCC